MEERWLPVVGFEGRYEVSDLGRVRSLPRIVTYSVVDYRNGVTRMVSYPVDGTVLRPAAQKSGHMYVNLGRSVTRRVHRLVLTAFVGLCPEGMEGCHRNSDPSNNALSNLRWGTSTDNKADMVAADRHARGTRMPTAVLTEATAAQALALRGKMSQASISRLLGVGRSTIQAVHDGRTWKHVREMLHDH